MMQNFTKWNLLRLKEITYVCCDPVWLYFRPTISSSVVVVFCINNNKIVVVVVVVVVVVSYFTAAERSDQ